MKKHKQVMPPIRDELLDQLEEQMSSGLLWIIWDSFDYQLDLLLSEYSILGVIYYEET